MKKEYVILIVVSLLYGGLAYASSGLWYFAVAVGVLGLFTGLFFVLPQAKAFSTKCRLRHEGYLFIHGYLVTLSVCMSLEKAFEVGSNSLGKEFHQLDATLEAMEPRQKVEYLETYFQSDLYRMFLQILKLYLDRGGDVLKLSSELTAEASRVEETEQSYQKTAMRKLSGFLLLWAMALVIVVFIRFGLNSFFQSMQQSWTYLGSLALFYVFCLGSIAYYVKAHTGGTWNFFPKRRKHS